MSLKYNTLPEKILCRVCQAFLKIGMKLLPWKTPEVIEGPESSAKLPMIVRERGFKNVLVVTGKNIRKRGLPDNMLKAMDKAGINYVIYDGYQPDPTDINVFDGARLFRENKCDAIIALGGGSPIDCAKAIAASAARPRKTIKQLQGLLKVRRKTPPVFAAPTTAGTGSETTIAAVITEASTHHKASINDICLMPAAAVLDPELTAGLPPYDTAITGFDALCHAVECYTNGKYNGRLENELCKKAVKLIYNNLHKAYSNGRDMEARQNMQRAAFCAGRAFTRGCVGYVHAVGHTLGGLYGIPHGLAMAVILPHVMRKFGSAAESKLSELADLCGLNGKNRSEKAAEFIDWIDREKEAMGIPKYFDMIKNEDFPLIAKWALKEANPIYPVPKIWGEKDFLDILKVIKGAP